MFNNGGKSGMEMMIGSLVKSLGVPPDALPKYIAQGQQLATAFVASIQSIDKRLAAIEARLAALEPKPEPAPENQAVQ